LNKILRIKTLRKRQY